MRKLNGRGLLKSGVFLSCWCLCLLKSGAQGNLVQNGQFTSPNGSSIPAWTYPGYIYVPGNPDVSGTDGASFVGISQYISQNLNTVPGQVYRLRFSIRASIPGMAQAGPNGVGVQWGAQSLGIFQLEHPSTTWINHQLLVTAQTAETKLNFTQAYGANPYLDGVSVIPIPEPGTVTFSLAGAVVMLGLGHCRTRVKD